MLSRNILLSCVIILILSNQNFSQSLEPNVVATVGEHKIFSEDFLDRYTDYLISTGINDNIAVREAILNNMINELLLYYYDDNTSIFSDLEYQKEIAWVSKQSPLAYLKDQEVFAKINVTENELRNTFAKVNETIAASHLYAPTSEEADYLYSLVQMGVDWDNLAAQVFSDSTLRDNGGYLGYFTWGDMDPAFEESAYSLKVGEVSKPVKTDYGYSIIRLEDRIPRPLLTEYEFQNKKNKLERIIKIKKKSESEKKYLQIIFDESKYFLNQKSLENIVNYFQLSDIERKESNNKINPESICVEYNGMDFSEQFMVDQINMIPDYHKVKIKSYDALKLVIKGITIQQLLYSEVIKKGYDKVPIVIEKTNKLKQQLFLKYKMSKILSNIEVTDSSLKNYYKENLTLFKIPNEISIQEIIVEDKTKADSIFRLLLTGEDFGKLARNFSLRKSSANNDGVIEYSELSKFGNLKSELWKNEIGKLMEPMEVYGYYGIFKVLGKREGKPKSFEEAKNTVEKLYKNDYRKLLIEQYLEKIKKNVTISINFNVLSSLKTL